MNKKEERRKEQQERREMTEERQRTANGGKAQEIKEGNLKRSEREVARANGNVGTPDQRGSAPKVGLLYEFPERKPD